MSKKSSRRGKRLIEPYKQLRFGVMFLLINLIFSSLIVGVFGYFLWDMYEALSVYFQLDESESMITGAKFMQPAIAALVLYASFIAITLFMSVHYTHQIYGPMVSIQRFLDELIAGKTPNPIALRASDQLKELVTRLNRIAGKVQDEELSSLAVLENAFAELAEGRKPEPILLEKSDPLANLANKINSFVENTK